MGKCASHRLCEEEVGEKDTRGNADTKEETANDQSQADRDQ